MAGNPSLLKNLQQQLQPAQAWSAILGLVVFSALGIIVGAGKTMNLLCPLGALSVGILLYFHYPTLYVSFSWWLWFLTPLVRRLADYRSSYTESSPMMIAPYLVTGLTLITLLKYLPSAHKKGELAFILSFFGVMYGLCIGAVASRPTALIEPFLSWLTPIAFGFHLFINWRAYPSYRQNMQRTFFWGVFVMGVYGVLQFISLPEWDRVWLANSGLKSAGNPEADGGLRVWSTMNSGEPFAAYMAGSLLVLLSCQNPFFLPTSVAGYLALFLTTVRSAWLGWAAGLLTLVSFLKEGLQLRLIAIFLVIALCVIPLTTVEPFAGKINDRVESLTNLQEDSSAQYRQEMFRQNIDAAMSNFVGDGLGKGIGDSSLLSMFFELGWVGVSLYLGGMLLLIFQLFQGVEGRFDLFAAAARAVVVSALVRLPVNTVLSGVSGVLLWGFLGIGLAAQRYYRYQQLLDSPSLLQGTSLSTTRLTRR